MRAAPSSIFRTTASQDTFLGLIFCLMVSVLLHLLLVITVANGYFYSVPADNGGAPHPSHILGTVSLKSDKNKPATPPPPVSHTAKTADLSPQASPKAPRPEASATLSLDPVYYELEELTQPPRLIGPISLDDAELLEQMHAWSVKLRLLIDAKGVVQQVLVSESTLEPKFMGAIIRALMRTNFEPGRISEATVRSQYFIEINSTGPSSPHSTSTPLP